MKNSIFTIVPYKVGKLWLFDDEKRNIFGEPFLEKASRTIDFYAEGKEGIMIIFSDIMFDGANSKLDFLEKSGSGFNYIDKKSGITSWLCPTLLEYFEYPPKNIYIKIE